MSKTKPAITDARATKKEICLVFLMKTSTRRIRKAAAKGIRAGESL